MFLGATPGLLAMSVATGWPDDDDESSAVPVQPSAPPVSAGNYTTVMTRVYATTSTFPVWATSPEAHPPTPGDSTEGSR